MAAIRADLFISVLISGVLFLGSHALTEKYMSATDTDVLDGLKVITDSSIGARADESTPVAHTFDDVKSMGGNFTIQVGTRGYEVIPGSGGFFTVELEDETAVLAKILMDSVVRTDDGRYQLPIGKVVEKPVADNIVTLADSDYPIKDSSFYIDMKGKHTSGVETSFFDAAFLGDIINLVVLFGSFALIRFITVRAGIFPPMIQKKQYK